MTSPRAAAVSLALALTLSLSAPTTMTATSATTESDLREQTSSSDHGAPDDDSISPPPSRTWRWPVEHDATVLRPFLAPAHEYGAGHRGIDLAASVGATVRSPAAGVVAFRGVVVDRPVLTIDHGGGVVTTFEPLDSALTAGASVDAGQEIGRVSAGGHAGRDALHLGARWHGVYIDPMAFFGRAPRAILLPCCR